MMRPMHKSLARICDQAASKRLAQSIAVEKRRLLWADAASELSCFEDGKAVESLFQDIDPNSPHYRKGISREVMK